MYVYHFSEAPNITKFVPRAPLAHPDAEALVYAIDAEHTPLYYFPRDCPRVCFWLLPTTTQEDRERHYANVTASKVIAVESAWVSRLQNVQLYRYSFDSRDFVATGDHGVYVSRNTVAPLSVESAGDLLEQLAQADVELRITPSLVPLGQAIIKTTLHFSRIRMMYAQNTFPVWHATPLLTLDVYEHAYYLDFQTDNVCNHSVLFRNPSPNSRVASGLGESSMYDTFSPSKQTALYTYV